LLWSRPFVPCSAASKRSFHPADRGITRRKLKIALTVTAFVMGLLFGARLIGAITQARTASRGQPAPAPVDVRR
jgi:hypothetical protein